MNQTGCKKEKNGFSVLMSVYVKEQPEYLRMALESNLDHQTRKPNELVLVCDGPLNEELYAVIESFEQRHPQILRVFRREENEGLGKALNFGLEQCSYDLVARSDSDDICYARRFEMQIAYLEKHPEISVVSGAIHEFEKNPSEDGRMKHMPCTHEEICRYVKSRNPINHMAAAFRKSDVQKVGSYQHLFYLEDYYLWVRMIASGMKMGNLKECLVHARVGNGMAKRRGDRRQIAGWRELNRYMLEHGMTTGAGCCMSMLRIYVWCAVPASIRTQVYDRLLRSGR